MKITELARTINCSVVIRSRDFQNWYASMETLEGTSTGGYGNGKTPDEALKTYCEKVKGKDDSIFKNGKDVKIQFPNILEVE